MGTRSVTHVMDEGETIVSMYRHMDGYPSGHGQDLKDFLAGMVVGNGIGVNTPLRYANGMGCLAAQMVESFKEGAGGIYLVKTGRDAGQDYDYFISLVNGVLHLKIEHHDKTIYDGPANKADMDAIEAKENEEPDGPVTVDEDLN